METYSRRQFLKFAGITLAARQIDFLPALQPPAVGRVHMGRALAAVPVYNSPRSTSAIMTTLWPDSIVNILDAQDDWYRLAAGYAERSTIQPMTHYEYLPNLPQAECPFWGEVVAAAAPVRQHCAADAPLVTRIGHGGVAAIVDYLPGEPDGWYGVADESGDFTGWTQASHWRTIGEPQIEGGNHRLEIDLINQVLTAWDHNTLVLQAPISTNPLTEAGTYTVQRHQPGGGRLTTDDDPSRYHGLPWMIGFGEDHLLTGVYWHNQFGSKTAGPAIQVTPFLARWLYGWLDDGNRIDVI